jgi:hypothetical protein
MLNLGLDVYESLGSFSEMFDLPSVATGEWLGLFSQTMKVIDRFWLVINHFERLV